LVKKKIINDKNENIIVYYLNDGVYNSFNYTFFIYSLDGKLNIDNNSISINNHKHFEEILKNNNINILDKDSKSFQYSYMNYI